MVDAVANAFPLRPDRAALIVVDMQNDFVRVGAPLEVPDARETIGGHLELLDWFRRRGRRVFEGGFQAGVVGDGVPSYAPDLHRASLAPLAMKYGRVVTAREAMGELER